MRAAFRLATITFLLAGLASPAFAQSAPPYNPPPPSNAPPPPPPGQAESRFSSNELLASGHRFFGGVSRGLAQIVEKAVSQWGLPNGYILGEEASGAFIAGLRYGEGILYTKNAGDLKVFWQGPSLGFPGGDFHNPLSLGDLVEEHGPREFGYRGHVGSGDGRKGHPAGGEVPGQIGRAHV